MLPTRESRDVCPSANSVLESVVESDVLEPVVGACLGTQPRLSQLRGTRGCSGVVQRSAALGVATRVSLAADMWNPFHPRQGLA